MNNIATKFMGLVLIFLSFGCFEDRSRMVIDGKLEPPYPDSSENDKTIGGIDSNGDGVRDDVERWINRKFSKDKQYNLRQVYKQFARETELLLLPCENLSRDKLRKRFLATMKASECAAFIYYVLKEDAGGMGKVNKVTNDITDKIVNTDERKKQFRKSQAKFHLMKFSISSSSERQKQCDFELRSSK